MSVMKSFFPFFFPRLKADMTLFLARNEKRMMTRPAPILPIGRPEAE
jgi:hypothetical protein